MARGGAGFLRTQALMFWLVILLVGQSMAPLTLSEDSSNESTEARDGDVWIDGGVHWPQFGRTPGHEASIPAHAPSSPETNELLSITNPVVNLGSLP